MKKLLLILPIVAIAMVRCKERNVKHIYIETYNNDFRHGSIYFDLKQISSDRYYDEYLFIGKDGFGNTFDSTIITLVK